jgi:hypothetical protein
LTIAFKTEDVLRLVHASHRTGSDAISLIEVRTFSYFSDHADTFESFLEQFEDHDVHTFEPTEPNFIRATGWQFLVNGFGRIILRHQIMKQKLHNLLKTPRERVWITKACHSITEISYVMVSPTKGHLAEYEHNVVFWYGFSRSRPRPPFVPTPRQVPLPAAGHPLPLRRRIPVRTRSIRVRRVPYVLATGAEVTVRTLEHR